MPAYVGNKYNRSPRFLTELSMTDWARIQNHYAHLSGMNMTNNDGRREVYYNNIKYRSNGVIMKRRTMSNDVFINLKEVNILTNKGNFFLITTDKDLICNARHNLFIDTSSRINYNDNEDGKYVPSGKHKLCICTYNHQKSQTGGTGERSI